MVEYTSIPVSKDFRNAIYNEKGPGESYQDVLIEALDGDREIDLSDIK